MSQNNHVIKFSLDRETIKKFMSVKGATLEKRNDRLEVVFPDSRIKLEADKKEPTTATYYNNKSSNLHFLGPTVTAKATHVLVDKKESEKTRGVELLDIPSIHTPTSPIKPKLKKPSSTLKTNNSSNNNNNTKKANIPPPPRRSVTPQNTPRPSSNNPHLEKLSDRVIQLLAIKPYQITTMAKALETTSWDIKRIVDDVGICIPDQSSQKKKYCLKPQLYKNVRIWDWPLYTETEKDTVYANAKEAYDILQLPPDAIERANLTSDHRSRPHSSDHRYATTTTTTTKKKSSLKKEEKKSVGVVDIKGKGKSHGYPAAVAAVESVARTTPSPITTSPTSLPPLPSLPPSLPVQQTLSSSTSSSSATSVTPLVRSPLKTKASARNGLLKPSSSNRKVSTKTSQISATSPPPPPPTTAPPALPPPPPRPVSCFVPSMAYVTPNVQKRKEVKTESRQGYGITSNTRTKANQEYTQNRVSNSEPVELSEIPTQAVFDKYCNKFLKHQKEYQNSKMNFKSKYPEYIKALQHTAPPTGSKRSYFDLKLEYHDMVKDQYLKNGDETSWREAESQLRDCNAKRRRLNFMWSSIQKNLHDHHYKLNQ